MQETVIDQYTNERPLYVDYTKRMKTLMEEILKQQGIKVHLIEARAKTIDSFKEKIRRPEKHYDNPLKELTDLSGIRIIIFYGDDVEKVAKILTNEFSIVDRETVHQPNEYPPDQFGYISLHYVVKLSPARASLPEWENYNQFMSEIQIRTVLQHSWATASHALQYKNESGVPKQLRRKLFRLAGLFELVDEQLIAIRNEIEETRARTSAALQQGDEAIPINSITLSEFIPQWDKLKSTKDIMRSIGYVFDYSPFDIDYLGEIASHCERIGITTIGELISNLNYDPKRYLEEVFIPNNIWYITEDFMILLLLIRARISDFTIEDLIRSGWNKLTAKRIINKATADLK